MMFTAITPRWTRRAETMDERIIDLDALPERLADALEETWTWQHADEVTRCRACERYDKASMSCSGGMDAEMWPADWCCFGEPK